MRIHNPYQNVNWDAFRPHRTELHCHTCASDGEADFGEMIEAYYEAGYDCLAIADHGIVDRSWTEPNFRPLRKLFTFQKRPFRKPAGLAEERLREIGEGVGRGGRGMLRVPFGTEHSPGGGKWAHVCSWFGDTPSAALGRADYDKAVRRADSAGALCVINHPTSSMKNGDRPYAQVYEGKHASYVQKLRRLLEKYPSLLGIEHRGDYDRKLWDILLRTFAPMGRNVFAVGSTDAHDVKTIEGGVGWVEAMMPENTVGNLRQCLEDGAFFAASRYVSFIQTPELLAACPDLPELIAPYPSLLRGMRKDQLAKMHFLYGEGFYFSRRPTEEPMPTVTKITVEDSVISILADNCDIILWVSDGKYIASGEKIHLNDREGLGDYVRAELWGPGGNLYTQPFLLQYEN